METPTVPLSEESIGFLSEVRKGKARRFALICKGPQILSLVVYKKGTVEAKKKEAKEAGTGQFYFGVVEGRGVDLVFKLARTDGFDREPCKSTVLKKFLLEHTEFKVAPRFEIIDAQSIVLDESDPLTQRFLRLQADAIAAIELHPARGGEIENLCRAIGLLLESGDQAASTRIAELEGLLAGLVDATAGAGRPDTVSSPEADAYRQRIGAMKQKLDRALTAGTPATGPLKNRLTQAVAAAKKGDFAAAQRLLDVVDRYIDLSGEFKKLASDIGVVKRKVPGAAPRLDAVWGYAEAQAIDGSIDKSAQALVRLRQEMKNAVASAVGASQAEKLGIAPGIVAERKKILLSRWQSTLATMDKEVDRLQARIAAALPHENAKGISRRLRAKLDDLVADLSISISGVDASTPGALERMQKAVRKCRAAVTKSRLLTLLQTAEKRIGVAFDARSIFLNAITELDAQLAG